LQQTVKVGATAAATVAATDYLPQLFPKPLRHSVLATIAPYIQYVATTVKNVYIFYAVLTIIEIKYCAINCL